MRHLKAGNRLGVTTAHRLAMMRNMVTSIIENGQITCTLARAKEVRKPLEKMIGLGKRGTLHSRRQALGFVKSKEAMAQLFGDLAERYKDRNGGYCRIIKLGKNRLGDNSEMAILQLLGSEGDKLSELKIQKSTKKKQNKKESTVLKEISEEIQQISETEGNTKKEQIQKEKQTEKKNSSEIKNNIKDDNKDDLKENTQAEASQVQNDDATEEKQTEKKNSSEIKNNIKDDNKNDLKENTQAEASQVQNDDATEEKQTEKTEAELNKEKSATEAKPESTDESEALKKTKS